MNAMLFGFLSMGGWQIVLILVVILVLFGGKKMPELARGLGQSIKEFKKATREASDEINRVIDEDPHHRAPTPQPPASQVQSPPSAATQPVEKNAPAAKA
jgi:sec-independent protein translocase protein TatA